MFTDKHSATSLLHGIIPPLVTPLVDSDTLDVAGLERLVEHTISGGVHGLFILGTTGEGPSLNHLLRQELVTKVCAQVAGRVPVVVGITDTVLSDSVALAKHAEQAGATAVVLAAPYYFNLSQSEFLNYFSKLVERINLPLYLYNMPSLTKFSLSPETVVAAAKFPQVCGIKDSSGDMSYFHKLSMACGNENNFVYLCGKEDLLAESLLLGADGGVPAGANFYPELYVDLFNAVKASDLIKVRDLHAKVLEIGHALYRVGHNPGSSYLHGVKTTLSCLGICNDYMVEPYSKFTGQERQIIETRLHELGLIK